MKINGDSCVVKNVLERLACSRVKHLELKRISL